MTEQYAMKAERSYVPNWLNKNSRTPTMVDDGGTGGYNQSKGKKVLVEEAHSPDSKEFLSKIAQLGEVKPGFIGEVDRRRADTADPFYDYHFMVQTKDGSWAEKRASTGESTPYDSFGENPSTIVWKHDENIKYDSEIVYLAVHLPKQNSSRRRAVWENL